MLSFAWGVKKIKPEWKERMDQKTLLRYATLTVPRYTSYPTAADFGPVDDEQRAQWLGALRADQPVSLYIHVVYCREICFYCGCHSKIALRDHVVADYGASLIKDIYGQAKYMQIRPKVAHLHWGGGTPSVLARETFDDIMAALHDCFDFTDDCEHAIELDPRYVNEELVSMLCDIGVNRVSLGVQDINIEVQEAIGRVQPIEMVENSVALLRGAGINRINFDLLYGLPLQTEDSLRETCLRVGAFKPDRIACYGYAHLPKRRANQKLIDEKHLPGALERFRQAEVVTESFTEMGYDAIGIDHFARPDDPLAVAAQKGRLHRNFQGYTDDDCPVLIGFGCSSISQFNEGFAQTVADVTRYRQEMDEGALGTVRGIAVDDEDLLRRRLISDLMCNFTVDLAQYGGRDRYCQALEGLKPIIADGVAEEKNGIITMTEEGKPFVRAVAALFDIYRQKNVATFSSAV